MFSDSHSTPRDPTSSVSERSTANGQALFCRQPSKLPKLSSMSRPNLPKQKRLRVTMSSATLTSNDRKSSINHCPSRSTLPPVGNFMADQVPRNSHNFSSKLKQITSRKLSRMPRLSISTIENSSKVLVDHVKRITDTEKYRVGARAFKYVAVIGVLLLYTVAGGFIFSYLESANFESDIKKMSQQFDSFLADICISIQPRNGTVSECKRRVTATLLNISSGFEWILTYTQRLYITENQSIASYQDWTYSKSSFFASSIFTTIGYGDITPKTWQGKFAVIVYGTIGIPLMLLVMSELGIFLKQCIQLVWLAVLNQCSKKDSNLDQKTPNLPISLAICILYSYLFVGAGLFMLYEKSWSYFDAFYFAFQTLSTLGFGDILPQNKNHIYFSFVYIILGIALNSMCLSTIRDHIQQNYEKMQAKTLQTKDRLRNKWKSVLETAKQHQQKEGKSSAKGSSTSTLNGHAPSGSPLRELYQQERVPVP